MMEQETQAREAGGVATASLGLTPWSGEQGLFCKEGEYWTVGYARALWRLKDMRGLAYIAQLLRAPGTAFHVLDLVRGSAASAEAREHGGAAFGSEGKGSEAELPVGTLGDAGAWLDEQAKIAYRRRLTELREELQTAKALGQIAQAEEAEREINVLMAELAHATGLGGRDRRAASAAERARQSVTRSIKSAVNKITEYQPTLGHLLARGIKTGTYCCYTPNPHETITWDFAAQRENLALSSLQASSLSDGAVPPPGSATSDARGGVWRTAINGTEFVGRQQETALLRSLIDRTRNGQGSVVLLAGSQGVGKTRLAMEVAEDAVCQGLRILIGHCYEREDPYPYLPFAEMLEAELARASSPEVFQQWLGEDAAELAQLMPSLRSLFPDLPPPPQPPSQQARRSLFNSMVALLHRVAGTVPLFLIVEDLQWADEATLTLFHHLALRILDLPVILVGTYRDLEVDTNPALGRTLEELIRQGIRPRKLQGLSEQSVAQMLGHLSTQEPPAQLVNRIFGDTQGNPFFVEELYRHLVEEGRTFDGSGALRVDVGLDEVGVPDTVRLVLGRRLARLSDDAQAVLMTAATIGYSFRFELLQALQPCTAPDDLLTVLEQAQRLGLMRSSADSQAESFTFTQGLVRQTLLTSISILRRQRLQMKMAEALRKAPPEAVGENVVALAHQARQAGNLVEDQRSVRCLALAGQRAVPVTALAQAPSRRRRAQGSHTPTAPTHWCVRDNGEMPIPGSAKFPLPSLTCDVHAPSLCNSLSRFGN